MSCLTFMVSGSQIGQTILSPLLQTAGISHSVHCEVMVNSGVETRILIWPLIYFQSQMLFLLLLMFQNLFSVRKFRSLTPWPLSTFLKEFSEWSINSGENIQPAGLWIGSDGLAFLNSQCLVVSAVFWEAIL